MVMYVDRRVMVLSLNSWTNNTSEIYSSNMIFGLEGLNRRIILAYPKLKCYNLYQRLMINFSILSSKEAAFGQHTYLCFSYPGP